MRVVTGSEMQKIDKRAIQEFEIPRLTLMENAGEVVYEEILKNYPDAVGAEGARARQGAGGE